MLATETLIRLELLQLLPLSKRDRHLGKVSVSTWWKLALHWRGIGGEKGQLRPTEHRPDLCITAFTSPRLKLTHSPGKREVERQREMKNHFVSQEQSREGKQTIKTGEGFTYQVLLFFLYVHVFPEALWKHTHTHRNKSPKSALRRKIDIN